MGILQIYAKTKRYFELKNEIYLIECREKERLEKEYKFFSDGMFEEALVNNIDYQHLNTKMDEIEKQLFLEFRITNNKAIDEEAEAQLDYIRSMM